MSNHDPIVDPSEDCDFDNEVLPSSVGQQHIDLAASSAQDASSILGGVFNGGSLAVTGSPFKKSYSNNSIEEATSLEDEPLQIVSQALSPFRIEPIRSSPLSSRSKDPHNFSVEVPIADSLPPHVMELDSPEHDYEDDDSNEFNIECSTTPAQKVTQEEFDDKLDLFSQEIIDMEAQPIKRNSDYLEWQKLNSSTSNKGNVTLSQADLFGESQSITTEKQECLKLSKPINFPCIGENVEHSDCSSKPPDSLCKENDSIFDERHVQKCTTADLLTPNKMATSLLGNSPTKRKREPSEEHKSGLENKLLKTDSSNLADNESDSEVEIIGDTSRDQSIEVVYDKKNIEKTFQESQCLDSQDLKLMFSGNTQSESQLFNESSILSKSNFILPNINLEESRMKHSQSLLSMPDSNSLICRDSLSSSHSESTSQLETTISATQLETLCKPAIFSQPKPNIEPLLACPIKDADSILAKKSCSNHSTNQFNSVSLSQGNNTSLYFTTVESPHQSLSAHKVNSFVEQDESIATTSEPINVNQTGICLPHFSTPSQEVTQEASESMFVKIPKAAQDRLCDELNEKQLHNTNSPGIDMLDSSNEMEDKSIRSSTCKYVNESVHNSSSQSTPVSSINDSQSSQSTPFTSSHNVLEKSNWLFSNMTNEKKDTEDLQVSQTIVEDSDEEHKQNSKSIPKVINKKPDGKTLKTSTPNASAVISPNISSEGQSSISKATGINSTINSSEDHSSPAEVGHIHSDPSPMQDIYIDVESMTNVNDLIEAGWRKVGPQKVILPCIEMWVDPVSRDTTYTMRTPDGDIILKDDTSWKKVVIFSKEGSFRNNRISDISSISGTTGYLGDKSSSVLSSEPSRFESTRLSMASVTTVGGVFDNLPEDSRFQEKELIDVESNKTDGELFIPPLPLRVPLQRRILHGISSSEESFSPSEIRPKRSRGRGRPRGKSRGRGRGGISRDLPATPIKEGESETDETSLQIENPGSNPSLSEKDLKDVGCLTDDTNFTKKAEPGIFINPLIDAPEDVILQHLSDDLKKALQDAQIQLSEEEEEKFALHATNQIPPRDQKSQYDEVLSMVRSAKIQVNTLVFARYYDGKFYSAIVLNADRNDKWEVQYSLDNCKSSVREVYILPTDILPKGLSCFVRHPNSNYSDPGIVVGHILNASPRIHLIEISKGIIMKVTHSHIILKATVANELLESRRAFHSLMASPGVDVCLDNVIAGKTRQDSKSPMKPLSFDSKPDSNLDSSHSEAERRRGSLKDKCKLKIPTVMSDSSGSYEEPSILTTPKSSRKLSVSSPKTPKTPKSRLPRTPKTPKTPKTLVRTPKQKQNLPSPDKEDEDSSTGMLMNPVVQLIQLEEANLTPKKRGRKPGSGKHPKKILKVEEIPESNIDPRLGKLPEESCELLKGYKIIITHSDNPKTPVMEGVEILNMNKEYLKKQITMAQGQVLETFSEMQMQLLQSLQPRKPIHSQKDLFLRKTLPADESPTKFLCISNTYCLTAKFIQCLTVGIPIIDFVWVVHSISQNKCLNWYNYLLPAGMSLITGCVMEQSFNDSFKVSAIGEVAEILKGDKVFLATSSKPGFKDMWISLLSTAAASVFDMPSKGGNIQRLLDRRTAVVIADSSIPAEEEKRALDVGVPIVSSQWFIQSLLAGCKLDFNAHPEFSYKYVKDEQSDTSGGSCSKSSTISSNHR